MKNLVSAQLSDELIQGIKDKIQAIKADMPFLIALSPDERRSIPTMDNIRKPFVEKALSYGNSEPQIVPPYVDLEELKQDLALYDKLQEINRELSRLAEMVSDTTTAVSSDAYVAGLTIYNSAKMAAKTGIPGIDAIVSDLKNFFSRTSSTQEPLAEVD